MSKGAQVVKVERTVAWCGPLPTPEAMAGYVSIVPDAGERILSMAEQEAAERRSIEAADHKAINDARDEEIKRTHDDVKRGQTYALVTMLSIIVGAVACGITGHETAAAALAGIGAVGIVSNFIWRKK